MYANDVRLPKFPLPTLTDTFTRLRRSVSVFSTPEQLKEFDAMVHDAAAQLADAQQALVELSERFVNWLEPIWEEQAYLRQRYTVVVNSNVFASRNVDLPVPVFSDPHKRAALCIIESLHFRKLLIEESVKELGVPATRPLCMQQFKKYYATRVPKRGVDDLVVTHPMDATHAILMYKGAMFAIKLFRDDLSPDDSELNFQETLSCIEAGLRLLDERFKAMHSSGSQHGLGNCIGLMTAAHRDVAADIYHELLEANGGHNRKYFGLLHRETLTIVSLDDAPVHNHNEGLMRACHKDPHNRWYDRSTSQIVCSNGVSLFQAEHSPMDAIVSSTTPTDTVSIFGQHFIRSLRGDAIGIRHREQWDPEKQVTVFEWVIPQTTKDKLISVHTSHHASFEHCEVALFEFTKFGRKALRDVGVAPDAFVQASLQLAYFRLTKKLAPTTTTRADFGSISLFFLAADQIGSSSSFAPPPLRPHQYSTRS